MSDLLAQRLIESLERDRERMPRIEIPLRMRVEWRLGGLVWGAFVVLPAWIDHVRGRPAWIPTRGWGR